MTDKMTLEDQLDIYASAQANGANDSEMDRLKTHLANGDVPAVKEMLTFLSQRDGQPTGIQMPSAQRRPVGSSSNDEVVIPWTGYRQAEEDRRYAGKSATELAAMGAPEHVRRQALDRQWQSIEDQQTENDFQQKFGVPTSQRDELQTQLNADHELASQEVKQARANFQRAQTPAERRQAELELRSKLDKQWTIIEKAQQLG